MRVDTTVALLVLLCLAAAMAVLAAPAVASHGDEANFTVQPEERAPNASGATYDTWLEAEDSYENVTHITYRLPEKAFYDCREDDIRAFGIDRGGTHSGLTTDEEPPTVYRDFDGYYFEVEIDGSIDLAAGDQVVASVADCLYNPRDEGWYTGQFFLYDDEDVILQSTSHDYWICECEDESEARERLGPPPSESSSSPTPTPTEEPVVTDEPTPEPTPTDDPTPTESAPATATSTSTPADDDTPTPTETTRATTTDQATDDDPAATPTPTATGTASPEGTATEAADESEPVQPAEETETTPGSGPGFGVLAAVLALAAVALLARRRG